jgi:Ca2+-transporting ATPase
VMDRPPRPKNQRLLSMRLLARAYLWLGMIESVLCFVGFFVLIAASGYSVTNMYVACSTLTGSAATFCANSGLPGIIRVDLLPYSVRITSEVGRIYVMAASIFHMGVIATQIGNGLACRTERASFFVERGIKVGLRWMVSNRFLLLGIVAEITLINILVYVQPFQTVFEEGPISPLWWLFIIWYAPVLFLLEEGRKAVVRWQDRRRPAPAVAISAASESVHATERTKI